MASLGGRPQPGKASTTYYAMSADQQLSEAQRVLDTHITSSGTGRCLECGTCGPCWRPKTRERDTTRAFTRDEREAVMAYADKLARDEAVNPRTRRKRETVADLVAFMAGTGVRINEARNLRWDDMDLEASSVHIRGTKTRASDRSADLAGMAGRPDEEQGGSIWRRRVVFSSPHHLNEPERVWDQSNSAKALASIIKGSGFRWATPHSFRRTVATLLDQAGVPIATIADQLGHTDPAMTASKYLGRDLIGDKPSVAEQL